ncbi:MAG TPA: hypothetical protein VFE91_00865 [Nitrososphaerales archaeon]|nr:hypothetical protein [Nitrososphaerales archaeon]
MTLDAADEIEASRWVWSAADVPEMEVLIELICAEREVPMFVIAANTLTSLTITSVEAIAVVLGPARMKYAPIGTPPVGKLIEMAPDGSAVTVTVGSPVSSFPLLLVSSQTLMLAPGENPVPVTRTLAPLPKVEGAADMDGEEAKTLALESNSKAMTNTEPASRSGFLVPFRFAIEDRGNESRGDWKNMKQFFPAAIMLPYPNNS